MRMPSLPAGAAWVAGLSIAGLLLPEAVAYVGIAGAPPQAGVMALFAGLVVYGLMGNSRFAIVSSSSSSAAVLLAAMTSVQHVTAEQRHLMGVAMVLVAGVISQFIFISKPAVPYVLLRVQIASLPASAYAGWSVDDAVQAELGRAEGPPPARQRPIGKNENMVKRPALAWCVTDWRSCKMPFAIRQ